MKILLVYPKYPDTFWSFKYALRFVLKKAANPPLGIITVASLLPGEWDKKLIDLNVESLRSKDIKWADYVFISAMSIQRESAKHIIEQCKKFNKLVVAGGPLFTSDYNAFPKVDHFVLNEAEITLPVFLKHLEKGSLRKKYKTESYTNMSNSPTPDYSLIKLSKYNSLSIQYSRGCPFNCEFCNITSMLGHKVRVKSTSQIINELDNIYNLGWRKSIFFVDDNFIGNKKKLKDDLLPAIIRWMQSKNYPFKFTTEASIDLADDDTLMDLMVKAGFDTVFIGIETTHEESLQECNKVQNKNRNLIESVHKIQNAGIEVTGGFIVGFDNDKPTVFKKQVDFIRKSGIITAMVGLLNAPKTTQLYDRLKKEGRLLQESTGNNTDYTLNFIPKMNKNELVNGYKNIIQKIYSGENYYQRVLSFIKRFKPSIVSQTRLTAQHIIAFIKSMFLLGIVDKFRKYYWELILWCLLNRSGSLNKAIAYSIYGYHFRKIFKEII